MDGGGCSSVHPNPKFYRQQGTELVNHCEFVKELMDYLECVFSRKGNVSRIFDVCKAFYRSEKQDQSLIEFFMAYKKIIHVEFNMLMPFSSNVKVQQSQREQMAVMGFLAALPSEYDSAKAQILSSSEISSLQETFSRILRTEVSSSSSPTLVFAQTSSTLIGQTIESKRQRNRNSCPSDNTKGPGSRGVVCYYYCILLPPITKGEVDDLLVYTIASPVTPPVPAPVKPTPPIPAPVKPPITQVYTRRQNPLVSSPPPTASTLDPVPNDDLSIALRKGRRQCVHPISSFCTYNQLSSQSYSFIASLDSISLPNTFQEALSHPGCRNAMIEEMDALNGIGP